MTDRVRAVMKSAVTWLTLLLLVVQAAISELPLESDVVKFLVRVAAFLTAVVSIIRRTVEVPKEKRGIL